MNYLACIMGKPFKVENPFIWETKADIVSQIADAGCADLIKDTVSCAHVMEMTDLHTHCGKCSQCIDRRFATLASGNGNFDPQEMYKVDLLKGARETGEDKTMLESYVRTATLVTKMTEMEFFSHFGETSRVISHLDGTSSENAEKILDLHRRHAKQICGVVDKAIGEHAKEIREETLPASCLLILALPEGYRKSAELPAAKQKKAGNLFRREGDSWIVGYDDGEVFLKDAKGLRYIAFLLRYPKQEFHVLRLIQEVVGTASVEKGEIVDGMGKEQLAKEGLSISSLGESDEVIDAKALSSYKRQIEDIIEDIQEAEDNSDFNRAETLREQKEFLEEEIIKSSGLMGRIREFDNPSERARKSVTNAINRSLIKIQVEHPALGQHLRNSIKTGLSCSYTPDKPTSWDL